MKIGIVVTVLVNFRGAVETLQSVKTKHDYRIYIIDQWRHNRPLAQAWNQGAQQAFAEGCQFALVCNDDILFAPETIDAMVSEYVRLRTEKVIMVTPNNIKTELEAEGKDLYSILDYQRPKDLPVGVHDGPNFSCFLIAPEFFALHGTFDENFVPAWFEDNDSHYRAQLLGYREISTTAAPQVHIGGVATSMMHTIGMEPNSQKSREYYLKKWGGLPPGHGGKEVFTTPYNNPELSPREWVKE